MGLSIPNLEGLTKGSLSNLTFYVSNEIEIVRAKPLIVKNPRTTLQQLNRLNLNPLIQIYRQLKPLLIKSLNGRLENQSAYAKFMSLNLNRALVNGQFFFENLTVSGSVCDEDKFMFSFMPGEENNIKFTWLPSFDGNKFPDDILCFATYNNDSKEFGYIISNVFRSSGEFVTFLDLGPEKSKTIIYLFFVRSNFTDSGKASIIQIENIY